MIPLSTETKARIGNRITILIPARKYIMNLAWTEEKPMPAIELFACRLLILFERMLPIELREFFGLSEREEEELLNSLEDKRLATLDHQGYLVPSPLLKGQVGDGDGVPMLVKYNEQTEHVVLDALALTVRKEQRLSRLMFGLPELAMPESLKGLGMDKIIEEFGRQFRSYLEITRNNEYERQRTQLYKVMGCNASEVLQLAVDIEFTYLQAKGEPKQLIRSAERLGPNQSRPLSSKLEAHIADFLGSNYIEEKGTDAETYCQIADDHVLKPFVNGYRIDYSNWMHARDERKTGYGSPDTRGVFGPMYLIENRRDALQWIRKTIHEQNDVTDLKALWMPSNVPFWGANSDDVDRFVQDLKSILEQRDSDAKVSLIHQGKKWEVRSYLKNIFPYGLSTPLELDRIELFVIPGIFGLIQYHGQPNTDSGISLPIGYMTKDLSRIKSLELLFKSRIGDFSNLDASWGTCGESKSPATRNDLLPQNWLISTTRCATRPILSLNR
ncbi:hypothetical protein [Enterobacter mori]|jgi:hypothetical protein|uniref:hypothetical protein n=1 Tax=Enterobacter mori TaxID=539813 RepID=UPI001BA5D058|nr:hypothetical protein [Enterobacter mori]EKX7626690.1 hypothetical protein [Enterobacter mori]EME8858896.1 hypothetical protein [Enterobacter mori]EME8862486.1 hypothetical protein [Enterobacter mori]MBS0863898.1 hypothetical protein [Enterobacter mori]